MSQRYAAPFWLQLAGPVATAAAWAFASVTAAAAPETDPAAALLARYAALNQQLAQSPFQQHLYIESLENRHASQGDIYAIVDYPIATVSDAFTSPAHWCDALILHLNVKYCHPLSRDRRTVLSVAIGGKYDQPLTGAYRIELVYDIVASLPDYIDVDLNASKGPLGTGNYRISLEAVGLDEERTFVHLRYSYTYGFWARVAMKRYLRTSGSGKAGFTMVGDPNDPQPKFIGGFRGAVERNVMRYYLAIEAYLGALATSGPERFEQSLERWFDATERYPRQLHEVDREAYLAMKGREYRRQQTLQ
jgi:hypothetical protein